MRTYVAVINYGLSLQLVLDSSHVGYLKKTAREHAVLLNASSVAVYRHRRLCWTLDLLYDPVTDSYCFGRWQRWTSKKPNRPPLS